MKLTTKVRTFAVTMITLLTVGLGMQIFGLAYASAAGAPVYTISLNGDLPQMPESPSVLDPNTFESREKAQTELTSTVVNLILKKPYVLAQMKALEASSSQNPIGVPLVTKSVMSGIRLQFTCSAPKRLEPDFPYMPEGKESEIEYCRIEARMYWGSQQSPYATVTASGYIRKDFVMAAQHKDSDILITNVGTGLPLRSGLE